MIYDPSGRIARRQIGFLHEVRFISQEAAPKVDLVGGLCIEVNDPHDYNGVEVKGTHDSPSPATRSHLV